MAAATYDEIADWYAEYVDGEAYEFSRRVNDLLHALLGSGTGGVCVDIGCGTGARANAIRELGWTPIGVDVSVGQLRHAVKIEPVVVGDATRLPIQDSAAEAATCILCHTDVADYRAVVREAKRVLKAGGRFVHIGIHPTFTGAFADRTDPSRIIVDAGYHRHERRWDSFTPKGVRAKVGAWHMPLAELVNAFIDGGFTITKVVESGPGDALPDMLAIAARR
jgi:ubiquinone/menaquinone biosynthesis C-methylase UbiE